MITIEIIQKRIAESIRQSGLTQTEIAKKLSIKPTQICSYIHGRKLPALDTLANLCKVLDVDANYILGIDEETKNKAQISNSFNKIYNSGNLKF